MIFPYFNQVLGVLGALNFWPIAVYFPVEMYFVQSKTAPWTRKWLLLQSFSMFCLILSVVGLIGSVEGLLTAKFSWTLPSMFPTWDDLCMCGVYILQILSSLFKVDIYIYIWIKLGNWCVVCKLFVGLEMLAVWLSVSCTSQTLLVLGRFPYCTACILFFPILNSWSIWNPLMLDN